MMDDPILKFKQLFIYFYIKHSFVSYSFYFFFKGFTFHMVSVGVWVGQPLNFHQENELKI